MARFLYTVAVLALLPWAFLYLLWRSRRQPEYRRHWRERLGFFSARTHGLGRTVWIHAVSVGETRAAQPLVAALRSRYPDLRIVMSHMTPTGRETSLALFGASLERVYLPYDAPGAMTRFLDHFQPTLGLIVETELWPNLVAACERRKLPLLLVNARLSARSAQRYARLPTLTRQTLRGLATIAAQAEGDAQRLRDLGAGEVAVLGNMKFDIDPPEAQLALGRELRAGHGKRPLLLCASTREGEEALILDAWRRMGNTEVLLAMVPRHPQRFEEVAGLVVERGLTLCRRSAKSMPTADTAVWLGDSMGELFAWYAAADVAFVGGSLLDHGSQNLIEACAVGAPVLIGPSTFNFAEAAHSALDAQAAIQVADAEAMIATALELLRAPGQRAAMAEAGRAFATRHRGATARTMALIERLIPELR